MISRKDRVLVIAAHPDDETIGMGGTIAKFTSNQVKVSVLFIADGVSSREVHRESIMERRRASELALSKLGVNEFTFLDFPDNQLDSIPRLQIIREIEKILEDFKPTFVFTNSLEDLNVDHRVTAECSIVATRPNVDSQIRALINFEVCSSTDLFFGKKTFAPNIFVDISPHRNSKTDALNAYNVELNPHPSARSIDTILARNTYWGGFSGYPVAEAFKLSFYLHE
jgi:LmbE family N-acetylglucosaminyl deacetylase